MGRQRQTRARTSEPPPPPRPVRPWPAFVFAGVLALLPLVPSHPLAFLPPVLAWPAYLGGAAWVAIRAALDSRVWALPLDRFAWVFEALALVLVLGSYVLLKLPGLHASGTDDNIYYYMAVRFGEGAWPYRDFFFSHPPMHLVVPTLVFQAAGFSVGTAKLIPAVAQGLAGVFLYLAVRRASRTLAAVVLLMHLLAYQVLMGSTDMNGENLMTLFLMSALYCAVSGRPLSSGVLSAAAVSCGLYATAGVAALAVAAAASSRRVLARFGIGLGAALLVINLPFVIVGGANYFEGVFTYHLAKPIKGGGRWPVFSSWNPFSMGRALFHNLGVWLGSQEFRKSLYFHAPAFAAAGVALAGLAGRALWGWFWSGPEPRKGDTRVLDSWQAVLTPRDLLSGSPAGLVKIAVLAVVLFTFQWAALNEVYDFYLVPMMAFLAVPAGYALWSACDRVRVGPGWRGIAWPLLAVGLFWLHVPWAAWLGDRLWPDEARARGQVVTYDWRDPDILAGPAQVTRALFFAESRRKGEVTPYYRHYLWNKRLAFSTAQEIADYVRATTDPDETLTGASTLAPLVALLADRRLAGDEADTNAKRFKSGVLSEAAFFERVCSDRVRYIVSARRSYFHDDFMSKNPVVREFFARDRTFVDKKLQHFKDFPIILYRRTDRTDLPEGRVCEAR